MDIIGFTLLRNGLKYDYPFRESLKSLQGICSQVHLALGKSEDGTEELIARDFSKIQVTPTVWDESKRQGGIILSEQTNIALESIRKNYSEGWALYLQGDEVISERDYDLIYRDLKQAQNQGYDAVRFRYLHFWQSYDQIAIGKRWYPQEIRAVRIESKAQSYGDAQSFKDVSHVYESDAHIYHYGHVREASAYEKKKQDFHRWWHSDEEMKKKIAQAEVTDQNELCVRYLGPHPSFMFERMGSPEAPVIDTLTIYGDEGHFSEKFRNSICARKVHWTLDANLIKKIGPQSSVILEDWGLMNDLTTLGKYKSKLPLKMYSPQARPWTSEFVSILKLSEKGIFSR